MDLIQIQIQIPIYREPANMSKLASICRNWLLQYIVKTIYKCSGPYQIDYGVLFITECQTPYNIKNKTYELGSLSICQWLGRINKYILTSIYINLGLVRTCKIISLVNVN